MQKIYSPTNYTFKFTDDWYEFDYEKAHKMALTARNAEAKRLRKDGMVVKCFTFKNQRMTMGGDWFWKSPHRISSECLWA